MIETQSAIKIRIKGVHKSFGTHSVLSGVNLSIRRGETIVIIGGSGTGKSVLLKHTLGLLKPDTGTVAVLVDDHDARPVAPDDTPGQPSEPEDHAALVFRQYLESHDDQQGE